MKAMSDIGKFSDIVFSIISHLFVEIFMPQNSIVTKFYDLVLLVRYLRPAVFVCSFVEDESQSLSQLFDDDEISSSCLAAAAQPAGINALHLSASSSSSSS